MPISSCYAYWSTGVDVVDNWGCYSVEQANWEAIFDKKKICLIKAQQPQPVHWNLTLWTAQGVQAFELKKMQDQLKVEFNLMLKSFQDKTRIRSSQKVQSSVMQYNKDFKIPVEVVTIARKVKVYIDFGETSIWKSAILTFLPSISQLQRKMFKKGKIPRGNNDTFTEGKVF